MLESKIRIPVVYEDQRRALIIDRNETNKKLEDLISGIFQIDQSYKVICEKDNLEIVSLNEVMAGDTLLIQITEERASIKESVAIELKKEEKTEIDCSALVDKSFKGVDLLDELNVWAAGQNFKLRYPQGAKVLKKHVNRMISCRLDGCKFRLIFTADKVVGSTVNYKDSKVVQKLDFHLDSENSKIVHNHVLDYIVEDPITEEIIAEIDSLKGKMKTKEHLKEHINKKFKKEFEYHQISYQVDKLMLQNFGRCDEDALLFVEEIKKEVQKNGGGYEIEVSNNGNRELQKVLYVSKTMMEYSKKFLDIVLIDATYRRNRFNMPIINVIGVNNHGRNIMLAFGLLNEETNSAYDWFFKNLRKIWRKDPNYFISDESAAIISGIEKNFWSKRLLCAWHIQKNLIGHFSSLKASNEEIYEKIKNLPFVTRKEKFSSIIEDLKKPGVLTKSQLSYLCLKLETQEQWAKCLVKQEFVVAVSTTSRVECLHSVLKKHLNARSRLTEVLNRFKAIEGTQINQFHEEFERHKKKNKSDILEKSCFLTELNSNYSVYAMDKVSQKLGKCLLYRFEASSEGEWKIWNAFNKDCFVYQIKTRNNKIYCSCGESIYEGIPCRHELALCAMTSKDFTILHFEDRWRRDYFKFADVAFCDSSEDSSEEGSEDEVEVRHEDEDEDKQIVNNEEEKIDEDLKAQSLVSRIEERRNPEETRVTHKEEDHEELVGVKKKLTNPVKKRGPGRPRKDESNNTPKKYKRKASQAVPQEYNKKPSKDQNIRRPETRSSRVKEKQQQIETETRLILNLNEFKSRTRSGKSKLKVPEV